MDTFTPSTHSPRTLPKNAIGTVSMMISGCTSDSNCAAMITYTRNRLSPSAR